MRRRSITWVFIKNPKLSHFYRKGLGGRWVLFLVSLPMVVISFLISCFVGLSFLEGETGTILISLALGIASISVFGTFTYKFLCLGFGCIRERLALRTARAIEKIFDKENEQMTNEIENPEYKPHNLFDFFFGLIELVFFIVITIGALIIPILAGTGTITIF